MQGFGFKKTGCRTLYPSLFQQKNTLFRYQKQPGIYLSALQTYSQGNFIEAIEGGADYVAMISSPGICRLGEYGAGIQNTLEDMGYHANYIELQLYDGTKGMFRFLTELPT